MTSSLATEQHRLKHLGAWKWSLRAAGSSAGEMSPKVFSTLHFRLRILRKREQSRPHVLSGDLRTNRNNTTEAPSGNRGNDALDDPFSKSEVFVTYEQAERRFYKEK